MANFLLTQTGEEVQTILNEAPETKAGLQQEVTNREQAISAEQQAREQAIAAEATARADADAAIQTAINGKANASDVYTKSETYSKTEVDNMITTPDQQYVSVTATAQTTDVTDLLPATGAANTIYRVGNWDGTQYNDTCYSEYAWNGSAYIKLSTKSQVGDVYDISANHAGTKYADLAAALGTNGANIPQSLQRGGMSIKFVQSSDNKYVQYRLMSDTFNTTVTNWQGVDDEPTADSGNLVKSGGVYDWIMNSISRGLFFHPDHLIANTGGTEENSRYEASSSWDCFHVVINGQNRISIEGLKEGATYRFYNDMNIFDGELVVSKKTGSNTTGIVPEGSVICVVNTLHASYPNGYANFRLINDYTNEEYVRQNDMAINKGFYIDKNHIVSVNAGVVKYKKINDWDTLVVFTEGAKKIHVNGLNEGATYRFFDSADVFTGEDIAEHLIEENTTGVVPDGAVVEINSMRHISYPNGYADFSVYKEYGNNNKKAINMLLIGNSAAQDAIAYVPFILQNMGLTNVRIGLLMQSDSTIQMHVDNFTNESPVYFFYLFNSGSSWISSSTKSIQWALDNYQWDVVLFHQGANSSTSQYDGSIQPYLNQIANLISAYVDYGVKFVFCQNQSRPGESNKGSNWSDEVITQHYEKTVLYCQNILKETIFEAIVPVGTAVQNARTIPALKALGDYANESANTSGLGYLTYDGIHLQEGLPSQLSAYTFVLFLLDIYGMKELSINGENTRATSEWIQGKGIPGPHGTPIGSTDENCLMAQKCAIMAIKKPFEVTDMSYIINPI